VASKGAIIFKIRSGGVDLCRDLNVLLQKSFLRLLSESTYRELAGRSPTGQPHPPQINRKCCSSAALAGRGSGIVAGARNGPLMLAGGGRREEERRPLKK